MPIAHFTVVAVTVRPAPRVVTRLQVGVVGMIEEL
jgi:hypothetical protein